MEEIALQLKRLADATFQQAKAQLKAAHAAERNAAVAEQMLEMQKTNLAVTKALESELIQRGYQFEEPQ